MTLDDFLRHREQDGAHRQNLSRPKIDHGVVRTTEVRTGGWAAEELLQDHEHLQVPLSVLGGGKTTVQSVLHAVTLGQGNTLLSPVPPAFADVFACNADGEEQMWILRHGWRMVSTGLPQMLLVRLRLAACA